MKEMKSFLPVALFLLAFPGISPTGSSKPSDVSAGAIIPFASDGGIEIGHDGPGVTADQVYVVGFGNSFRARIESGRLDLSDEIHENLAFTLPRDGVVTSIAASFKFAAPPKLFHDEPGPPIIAQLWEATGPDDVFSRIPGALVSMPIETDTRNLVLSGISTGLAIPLTAQTRILMVFSAGAGVEHAIGKSSAGVNIN